MAKVPNWSPTVTYSFLGISSFSSAVWLLLLSVHAVSAERNISTPTQDRYTDRHRLRGSEGPIQSHTPVWFPSDQSALPVGLFVEEEEEKRVAGDNGRTEYGWQYWRGSGSIEASSEGTGNTIMKDNNKHI